MAMSLSLRVRLCVRVYVCMSFTFVSKDRKLAKNVNISFLNFLIEIEWRRYETLRYHL